MPQPYPNGELVIVVDCSEAWTVRHDSGLLCSAYEPGGVSSAGHRSLAVHPGSRGPFAAGGVVGPEVVGAGAGGVLCGDDVLGLGDVAGLGGALVTGGGVM